MFPWYHRGLPCIAAFQVGYPKWGVCQLWVIRASSGKIPMVVGSLPLAAYLNTPILVAHQLKSNCHDHHFSTIHMFIIVYPHMLAGCVPSTSKSRHDMTRSVAWCCRYVYIEIIESLTIRPDYNGCAPSCSFHRSAPICSCGTGACETGELAKLLPPGANLGRWASIWGHRKLISIIKYQTREFW